MKLNASHFSAPPLSLMTTFVTRSAPSRMMRTQSEGSELGSSDGNEQTLTSSASVAATLSDRLDEPTIYYLRVRQSDGEMAWTSPVWVDVQY